MPPKTVANNDALSSDIRQRRSELGLTIEDAAAKANVGSKTWSRYEAGASIRSDKIRGLCKALNWKCLPENEHVTAEVPKAPVDYMDHEAWSPFLAERCGRYAAVSFTVGSDILLDEVSDDLRNLMSMPKGAHIGELPASWLDSYLPEQFLTRYDYDFMYALKNTVIRLRAEARYAQHLTAHRVIDELVFHLIVKEAEFFMDELQPSHERDGESSDYEYWDAWPSDLCDDDDLKLFLYSSALLPLGHPYHFDRWLEEQFYTDR